MNIGKKPTDNELLQCLRQGMNAEEISAKYNRSIIGIQNRASELLYQMELESYRNMKTNPVKDITEDELLNQLPVDELTIGDVITENGAIIHRASGKAIHL